MAKNRWVSLRATPELYEAIRRAAADDHRSMASLCEMIMTGWLRERGYLPAGDGGTEPARRPGGRRGKK